LRKIEVIDKTWQEVQIDQPPRLGVKDHEKKSKKRGRGDSQINNLRDVGNIIKARIETIRLVI